jgi:hypothetical protein
MRSPKSLLDWILKYGPALRTVITPSDDVTTALPRGDGRGIIGPRGVDPAAVEERTRFGFDSSEDSAVGDHVDLTTVNKRRRNLGDVTALFPDNRLVGEIAGTFGAGGHQPIVLFGGVEPGESKVVFGFINEAIIVAIQFYGVTTKGTALSRVPPGAVT